MRGKKMRKFAIIFSIVLLAAAAGAKDIFRHEVKSAKKPWTHEKFLNSNARFSFIIVPDRTGSERPGVFPEAIKKANLFQPEFIISVGDLIQGPTEILEQSPYHLRKQWKELLSFTEKSEAPFFYVPGNHDISRTREGFPRANEDSAMVWKEFAGDAYYYFIYKNVLFLVLNTLEGRDARVPQVPMTESQAKWAVDVLKKHQDVRWTFVFLHQPDIWINKCYAPVEEELRKRKYTSFAGDWHHYIKFKRHGRDHYALATAGGISQMRGIKYGEFDHLTYVTMTEKEPVIVNIALDGILPEDVVTPANIRKPYRNHLDTEPFVPAKGEPWKAVIDSHTLRKNIGKGGGTLDGRVVKVSGKSCVELIDLDHPAPAGRKILLHAGCRADIKGGKDALFNVRVRMLDAKGKLLGSEGMTLKKSSAWKNSSVEFTVLPGTAKLQLEISALNMDEKSCGEVRNIFIFDTTHY